MPTFVAQTVSDYTVENINQIYNNLISSYTAEGIILMALVVLLFFVQIYYYIIVYGRIPKYRTPNELFVRSVEGLSVVVVAREDYSFLENTLPLLLTQEYDKFEIVVVDVGSNEDFYDALCSLKSIYPNLTTTKFEQDSRFPISNKMALNVGIKAAHFEYIIITTTDACPQSQRWLSLMAKGFTKGDVVLGYCAVERNKGLANKLMRLTRLMIGVRYLSSAIRGVPYRGMMQNMGFTRSIYFGVKGFDHLNMNLGEDDLFIQRIATKYNTAIVMHPNATVVQHQWGGLSLWRRLRRFHGFTFRYYSASVKRYVAMELISRAMFVLTVILAVVVLPLEIKIGAGILWLLRLVLVEFEMFRIRKRLGEAGLMWAYILHDLVAPFDELVLAVARRFRTVGGIWR